jgi:D-amino-acid dehydrogenase
VASLAEDGVGDTSFAVVGGMIVSADETELADAHQRLVRRAAPAAGAVSRLAPEDARALFPVLAPELSAVHVAGAGRVDGRQLRQALLTAAGKREARFAEGHAELVVDAARVTGVTVAGETIGADAFVVAAGAWSEELLAPLGIRTGVTPHRGQISHFELRADTSRWPVVLPVSSHYLLAFPGSRVVAGATREPGAGFDHRVTAAGQREVLDNALAVAPGLADATLLETRVGFRPGTEDGLPVLGASPEHPEVVLATGFGPAGLTVAPFAGSLVAGLVLGEPDTFGLGAFSPERFSPR